MEGKGKAAGLGGLGCVGVFIAFAVLALLFGGNAHLDFGGLLMLLAIGAVIGLIVNWIYQKGKRDAGS